MFEELVWIAFGGGLALVFLAGWIIGYSLARRRYSPLSPLSFDEHAESVLDVFGPIRREREAQRFYRAQKQFNDNLSYLAERRDKIT